MSKEKRTKKSPVNCFFCSEPIIGKITLEHIIANSLLGKLGIKEKTIDGQGSFQYSRVKVPAHETCNSEFGSRYENTILSLLEDPEKLYDTLSKEENVINHIYHPSSEITMIITTWLSKIFYGLFYNDFIKLNQSEWSSVYKEIIESNNFRLIQAAYKENLGFSLPSSLYVFKTLNENFDLRTTVIPEAIMIKINTIVFILCIGDGYLTKGYLSDINLTNLKSHLLEVEKAEPNAPVHLLALAEILAIRMCIPKSPSFIYNKGFMLNMSFQTGVKDPESFYGLDLEEFKKYREEILKSFNTL